MEFTDVFTSEDDAFQRMKMYEQGSWGYVCPPSSSQKTWSPTKSILRKSEFNMAAVSGDMKSGGASQIMAAVMANDLQQLQHCLQKPENLVKMVLDQEGRTCLHVSVEYGFLEITKMLLQAFPTYNVNTPDNNGSTCLHKAASIGHSEIIQCLLERGAQINVQDSTHGNTPLHEAAWKGYSISVEMLCRVARLPNLVNYALFTPLHLAVQGGHNQTARNLIKYGADLSAQNRFGDTPLHTAVRYGHAGVSRILATVCSTYSPATQCHNIGGRGWSSLIDCQNQNGDTPIHIAAALKRRKIARLLCDVGANRNIYNIQNQTALDVAIRKNHSELVHILQEYFPGVNPNNPTTESGRINCKSAEESPVHQKVNLHQAIQPQTFENQSKKEEKHRKRSKSKEKDSVKTNCKGTSGLKGWWFGKKRNKSKNKSTEDIEVIDQSQQQKTLTNQITPTQNQTFGVDMIPPRNINNQSSYQGDCPCHSTHTLTNVCVDHGYIDYHGPMPRYPYQPSNAWQRGSSLHSNKHPVAMQHGSPYKMYPHVDYKNYLIGESPEHANQLTNQKGSGGMKKSRSDESLNQSEHKMRMRADRHKKSSQQQAQPQPAGQDEKTTGSLIKGRRQVVFQQENQNKQQNIRRTSIRPSPDGQTCDPPNSNELLQKHKSLTRIGNVPSAGQRITLPSSRF